MGTFLGGIDRVSRNQSPVGPRRSRIGVGGLLHASSNQEPAPYEVKWSWKSPFTQAMLGWIGVALGLVSFLAGYQAFGPNFSSLLNGEGASLETGIAPDAAWIYVFLAAIVLLAVVIGLFRVAKNQTQRVGPSFLPVLTGWDHRLGLARFTGSCSMSRGKLRFCNKPTQRAVNLESGVRGKILELQMAMECVRNGDHWWRMDPAERAA